MQIPIEYNTTGDDGMGSVASGPILLSGCIPITRLFYLGPSASCRSPLLSVIISTSKSIL